jgi:hypothetical protein
MDQRPRQGEPLLHALGEGPDTVLPPFPQSHQFQSVFDCGAGIRHPVKSGEVLQISHRAQFVVKAGRFGQQADFFMERFDIAVGSLSGDGCVAGGRGDDSRQHPYGSGLPGPVRAEEPQHFPFLDLEVQGIDDGCLSVLFR